MKSDVTIGIDPGLSGAIAVITPTGYTVYDIPTIEVKVGKHSRRRYDIPSMVDIVERHWSASRSNDLTLSAWIELVHSMPGQGVAAMFSMGRGLGVCEGILSALDIPFYFVSPQSWKKSILRDSNKDKGSSVLKASQLFPEAKLRTERGRILDGRAEALLIAEYGQKHGHLNV